MATDALSGFSTRATPQTERARIDQIPNSAGGYTFKVDARTRARRFLTIGVETGTYYIARGDLVRENAASLIELASTLEGAKWLVDEAVAISEAGRAPRNNEALFALALVSGSKIPEARRYALDALPRVARIGTHLFIFARYAEQFRGWGRTMKRAVAQWYTDRGIDDLELQLVKYRQREGWSHRDLLRLSKPKGVNGHRSDLFGWVTHPDRTETGALQLVRAFEAAQRAASPTEVAELIRANPRLTWEMLPDSAATNPDVWKALIDTGMPTGAMLRQLPRLTRLGVLRDRESKHAVLERLSSGEALQKARIHPFKVLTALRTYSTGHSQRGDSAWSPDSDVIDVLDRAFYACFTNVVPTGKRLLLAIDVSGSMDWPSSTTKDGITAREVAAAMALVTKATELHNAEVMAFGHEFVPLPISPRQRMDDVLRTTASVGMQRTDCSLPMLYAGQNQLEIDQFVVYTDNETYAGRVHPHQALQAYRDASGIPAKLVVVGVAANDFSIADPDDPGMLDVSGFDSNTPELISAFARGEL